MGSYSEPFWIDPHELKPHPKNQYFFNEPTQEEIEELKQSMQQVGQIDIVVITEDKVILAGHTRVKVAKELGKKVLARYFYPSYEGEEVRLLTDSNTKRKFLHPKQLVKINQEYIKYLSKDELLERISPEIVDFINKNKVELTRDFLILLARLNKEQQLLILKNLKVFIKILPKEEKEEILRITKDDYDNFKKAQEKANIDINEMENSLKEREKLLKQIQNLQKRNYELEALNTKLDKDREAYKKFYDQSIKKLDEFKKQINILNDQIKKNQKEKIDPKLMDELKQLKKEYRLLKKELKEKEKENAKKEKELKKYKKEAIKNETLLKGLQEKFESDLEKRTKSVIDEFHKYKEQMQKKIRKQETLLKKKEKELKEKEKQFYNEQYQKVIKDELLQQKEKVKKIAFFLESIETFKSIIVERVEYALSCKEKGIIEPVQQLKQALKDLQKTIEEELLLLKE